MDIIIQDLMQVCPYGAYLAKVSPRYQFVNGERSKVLDGYNYVIANRKGFDKITIKTKDQEPKITQEALEASDKDIRVTVKGFKGKVYNVEGKVGISATAEEVILS